MNTNTIIIVLLIILLFLHFFIDYNVEYFSYEPLDKKKNFGRLGNRYSQKYFGSIENWSPLYANTLDDYATKCVSNAKNIKNEPLIADIINNNPKDNDIAIIHLRCSDVPFVRHIDYHLQTSEYYTFVFDILKKHNIKKVKIMLCTQHGTNDLANIKCSEYANKIIEWGLQNDLNMSKDIVCLSSEYETYKNLLSCKILVSTGGSFSFIPGIIKALENKEFFISPLFYTEDKDNLKTDQWYNELVNKVHWSMYNKKPILHSSIKDYNTFEYT